MLYFVFVSQVDTDGFGIPMDKIKQLQNGTDFIMCLCKCQLLSPVNLLYLQFLLNEIGADQSLIDEITTYGEKSKHNPLRVRIQNESSGKSEKNCDWF